MTDRQSASELADVLTRMEIKERNATIDRCAEIASAFKVNTDDPRTAQEQLAAAIRALKDKP